MKMALLKHMTIFARDPYKEAEFYQSMGMKIVLEAEDGKLGPALCLSDGYMNLTLLPAAKDRPEGFAHIGFQTDDVKTTHTAALAAGGKARRQLELEGRISDLEMYDPAGVIVELSSKDWPTGN
jgi:catechol 2,3-dioxygenase-like lactoylglutathione lyase family enzyme